jgi:hypothetical protein
MDIRTTAVAGTCALAAFAALTASPARADSADPAPPNLNGVPHLSSPQNLPPGTTADPPDGPQNSGLTYLQEIWNAVQTQNVSVGDAIMLLAQRPMDADSMPPPGLPAGPQPPPGS